MPWQRLLPLFLFYNIAFFGKSIVLNATFMNILLFTFLEFEFLNIFNNLIFCKDVLIVMKDYVHRTHTIIKEINESITLYMKYDENKISSF